MISKTLQTRDVGQSAMENFLPHIRRIDSPSTITYAYSNIHRTTPTSRRSAAGRRRRCTSTAAGRASAITSSSSTSLRRGPISAMLRSGPNHPEDCTVYDKDNLGAGHCEGSGVMHFASKTWRTLQNSKMWNRALTPLHSPLLCSFSRGRSCGMLSQSAQTYRTLCVSVGALARAPTARAS